MTTVGVLARFEFKPAHDEDAARFFSEGRTIVENQPETTGWFAFRLGPTTYCAFASFAHLFATPPTFDMVDIVEARIPVANA